MSDGARGGTFRAALSHRDYRFLLSSLAISDSGNWLYAASSIIYILDVTGSTGVGRGVAGSSGCCRT